MAGNKVKGKSSNTHQDQVAGTFEAITQDIGLKEGRRGLLYIMIVYILRNFSSKENPRTIGEIINILKITFGLEYDIETKGLEPRRFSDYVVFLEKFSCLEEKGNEEDSSAAMIRKQLGGYITHKGENPRKYYFVSDHDYKDIELVRSYINVRNNQDLRRGDVFTKEDLDYISQLCDMYAPNVSVDVLGKEQTFEEFQREFVLNREKRFMPISQGIDEEKLSFIRKYRIIYDILKRQENGTGKVIVLQIKTEASEGLYIPIMLSWDRNLLYLECRKKEDQSPKRIRLASISGISEVTYLYGKERINPLV
jgi:hypothetical protein